MRGLLVIAGLAGGASMFASDAAPSQVVYYCGNVVLVGHVEQQSYGGPSPPGALFGDAPVKLRIRVKRVAQGKEPRKLVEAVELTHVKGRTDGDYLFVLAPSGQTYEVVSKETLWTPDDIPHLQSSCGAAEN